MGISDLPALNASLNGLSTLFLVAGYILIKKEKKEAHRNCMIAALVTSAAFLTSYLIYHYHAGGTKFVNPEWVRPFYLAILISHIILAVVIVPLIITTVVFAATQRWEKHKAWARWTHPLWLYVSVTGVIIYFMLYQIWPQAQ